jgi:hypothetical protein
MWIRFVTSPTQRRSKRSTKKFYALANDCIISKGASFIEKKKLTNGSIGSKKAWEGRITREKHRYRGIHDELAAPRDRDSMKAQLKAGAFIYTCEIDRPKPEIMVAPPIRLSDFNPQRAASLEFNIYRFVEFKGDGRAL